MSARTMSVSLRRAAPPLSVSLGERNLPLRVTPPAPPASSTADRASATARAERMRARDFFIKNRSFLLPFAWLKNLSIRRSSRETAKKHRTALTSRLPLREIRAVLRRCCSNDVIGCDGAVFSRWQKRQFWGRFPCPAKICLSISFYKLYHVLSKNKISPKLIFLHRAEKRRSSSWNEQQKSSASGCLGPNALLFTACCFKETQIDTHCAEIDERTGTLR